MKNDTSLFIYARLDSSRLPRKAFIKIVDQRLIDIVMKRASQLGLGEVILVTTDRKIDDDLASYVSKSGYQVIRGNPFDLVERTIQAIDETRADFFLRMNGDSPFIDPELIRLAFSLRKDYQVVTNLISRTFPYGISVELINSKTYIDLSCDYYQSEAEHVTQHIYRNIEQMSHANLYTTTPFNHLSLAIDTQEDLERITDLLNQKKSQFDEIQWWEFFTDKKPTIRTD